MVAIHPGLYVSQYAKLLGLRVTLASEHARRAELAELVERHRPDGRINRTILTPTFKTEIVRPEPPAGRAAMKLMALIDTFPGLSVPQLGSEHRMNTDIVRDLVNRFEESGLVYLLDRRVYPVPSEWPTRPRLFRATRETVIEVGSRVREGRELRLTT